MLIWMKISRPRVMKPFVVKLYHGERYKRSIIANLLLTPQDSTGSDDGIDGRWRKVAGMSPALIVEYATERSSSN